MGLGNRQNQQLLHTNIYIHLLLHLVIQGAEEGVSEEDQVSEEVENELDIYAQMIGSTATKEKMKPRRRITQLQKLG